MDGRWREQEERRKWELRLVGKMRKYSCWVFFVVVKDTEPFKILLNIPHCREVPFTQELNISKAPEIP